MSNKRKGLLIAILVIAIILIFAIISVYMLFSTSSNEVDDEETDEMIFVFDYVCPWCSVWVDEVYPEIESVLEEKHVTFKTQSMVLLSEDSLSFAKVDQNVKEFYPEQYLDYLFVILDSLLNNENQDAKFHLDKVVAEFNFDNDVILNEPKTDVLDVTEKIINEFDIEFVPTLIFNGTKIEDPFDVGEIKGHLQ